MFRLKPVKEYLEYRQTAAAGKTINNFFSEQEQLQESTNFFCKV